MHYINNYFSNHMQQPQPPNQLTKVKGCLHILLTNTPPPRLPKTLPECFPNHPPHVDGGWEMYKNTYICLLYLITGKLKNPCCHL